MCAAGEFSATRTVAVLKHTHVASDLVPDFSAKAASGYFLFRHGEYSDFNYIPAECFPLRPVSDPVPLAYCLHQITSANPPGIAIDARDAKDLFS